jgi:hypothetical protein
MGEGRMNESVLTCLLEVCKVEQSSFIFVCMFMKDFNKGHSVKLHLSLEATFSQV